MNKRDCFINEDELNEYLDSELGGSRKLALEDHLRYCPDCSTRFEISFKLKTLLKSSRDQVHAPPWLKTRILSDIHAQSKVGVGGFWEYLTKAFRGKPLIPIAAASALVMVFILALFSKSDQKGTMPFVTAMVKEHYEYSDGSANGIKSNDPEEITSWISSNAGIDFALSSDQRIPLPNGACVIQKSGETVGYVSFDYQEKKVSLFMLKEKENELFGQREMNLGDISVFCGKCTGMNYVLWKSDDVVCVLVGDIPEKSLVNLAGYMI
ncbi:MAG: zf-HC2 domain-containing protein [candidate division Zixibacteria bacterium]